MSLTREELIEAAFASVEDFDPALLYTFRAPNVHSFVKREHIEAILRTVMFRILIDRPDDPVLFMAELVRNWKPSTIIVAGPPASGKHTLAEAVAGQLGLPVVSAAELVQGMMLTDTRIGRRMREMADRGEEIPDALVETLITQRLKESDCAELGWVLYDWPRTVQQAANLRSVGMEPQVVVIIDVPDQIIEDRVAFRVFDPVTNTLYNLMTQPPPLGTGGRCVTRPGETTDEILERLDHYHGQLDSLIGELGPPDRVKVIHADGNVPFDEIPLIAEKISRKLAV